MKHKNETFKGTGPPMPQTIVYPKIGSVSQRQSRVSRVIRDALSNALLRFDFHDTVQETYFVTISHIDMSADLRHAYVFVLVSDQNKANAVLKDLHINAPLLRQAIAHNTKLKFIPSLRFYLDQSPAHSQRIADLLAKSNTKHHAKTFK